MILGLFSQQILLVDFGNDSISKEFERSFNDLDISIHSLDVLPDTLGNYKMVFMLMHYGEYQHYLTAEEEQKLVNYLENSQGRLYLEVGNYWSENRNSKLSSLLKINAINNNNSDAYVFGMKETLSEGFRFEPKYFNHYIDDIHPVEPAIALFTTYYGTDYSGVAYCGDTYKTIGVSFEFQELKAQDPGYSKTDLLSRMLTFFNEPACGEPKLIFKLFPNPTTNFFYVTSNAYVKNIKLYNAIGQLVKEINDPTVVNIEDLKFGIYIARISVGDQVITTRVIRH